MRRHKIGVDINSFPPDKKPPDQQQRYELDEHGEYQMDTEVRMLAIHAYWFSRFHATKRSEK